MKNEKEQFRNLFGALSPDAEQLERMEKCIVQENNTQKRHRIRPAALIAAVVLIGAGITAVSAAPALSRYFFPDAGVVELDYEAEPLYLMLDADTGTDADFRIQYGYWYDSTAQFWIESQIRYEETDAGILMPDAAGSVELLLVANDSDGELRQQYRITVEDVSAEDAMNGVVFAGRTVQFNQVPAQYHPYIAENNGIRLTLIPLTQDMTAFAAEAEYVNGKGKVNLSDHYSYYMDSYAAVNAPSMVLVSEDSCEYVLSEIGDSDIFVLEEKPSSPITGFRSDALTFTSGASDSVTVSVEVPADGEASVLDLEFLFPDQAASGRIHAVGHNNPISDTEIIDRETEFPMGYLSVITDVTDRNGIRYWYSVHYTEEFEIHMSHYYENVVKSPYDRVIPVAPMSPKTRVSLDGLENQMHYTFHYISDRSDTVELVVDGYTALTQESWKIDFTAE